MTVFDYGAASDTGAIRGSNQDRFWADGSLFAVADGLGGHRGGEVAAAVAVDTLGRGPAPTDLDQLCALVQTAHEAIRAEAKTNPDVSGMCTTLCVLADLGSQAGEERLGVANVGDSRLYASTGADLVQVTRDHNLVSEMTRAGRLTRAEAAVHPDRNILTRALGFQPELLVDSFMLKVAKGARLLLCTDGLFSELDDAAISAVLRTREDPVVAADVLVSEAVRAGGRDNVTVVVVDVLDGPGPTDPLGGESPDTGLSGPVPASTGGWYPAR